MSCVSHIHNVLNNHTITQGLRSPPSPPIDVLRMKAEGHAHLPTYLPGWEQPESNLLDGIGEGQGKEQNAQAGWKLKRELSDLNCDRIVFLYDNRIEVRRTAPVLLKSRHRPTPQSRIF